MKKIFWVLAFLLAFPGMASAQSRIVGGQPVSPGQWPAQVALVKSSEGAAYGQFCGGTLIRRNWVATAAHCLYGYQSPGATRPKQVDVVLGQNLADEEERLDVARVVLHPSYPKWISTKKWIRARDIALVKTRDFSSKPPMPLVPGKRRGLWSAGKKVSTAGWGALNVAWTFPPLMLHSVDINIISSRYCSSRQVYGDNFLLGVEICAGVWNGGKDACWGDSGGPLVSEGYLVGITSWGGTAGKVALNGCASARYPGVWLAVAPQLKWIYKHINNEYS